jgi:hypothetical protein
VASALDPFRASNGGGRRVGAAELASFLDDPAAFRARLPAPPLAQPVRKARTVVALGAVAAVVVATFGWLVTRGTEPRPEGTPPEAAGGVTIEPVPQEADDRPAGPVPAQSQMPTDADETAPVLLPESDPAPAGSTAEPAPTEPQRADPPTATAEPAAGRLTVAVEPWAHVSIDGQPVGTTPLGGPVALRAGTHRVVLSNPDFPEHSVEVRIDAGEAERLAVSLWSLVARVSVEVSPWAEVSLDGRVLGTTPLRRAIVLPPGTHALTFAHPTLGSHEERVTVAAGEVRTVRVRLTDGTP